MTNSRLHRAAAATVLAAVFGASAGAGATAAPALSRTAVKKIATKVVHRNASALSVAHAASADTATTATTATTAGIAGRAGGVLRFTIPTQDPAATRTYHFPGLPVGTYLATYSIAVNAPAGSNVFCGFETAAGSEATDSAHLTPTYGTVTGSATVSTGPSFDLACNAAPTTLLVPPYYNSTVTFVPIAAPATAAATGS
jgi:hypothetical protein